MGPDGLSSRRRHHDEKVAALSDQGDMITLPSMDNQLAIPASLCTSPRCRAALVREEVTVTGKLIVVENDHSVRSPSDRTVVTSSLASLPLEHDDELLQSHEVASMIGSLTSHVLPANGFLDGFQVVWQDETGENCL